MPPNINIANAASSGLHHQSALSKKPLLLGIPGLCSSLVRLAKVFRSHPMRGMYHRALEERIGTVRCLGFNLFFLFS
jgi:hypothetical protein